jgi:hypothetical protein
MRPLKSAQVRSVLAATWPAGLRPAQDRRILCVSNDGNETVIDFFKFHLSGKWQARRLAADKFHNVVDLWKMRVLDVTAKGKSITEIYVDVQNNFDRPLNVCIPAGTYLRARGSHQNMAVRKEIVFTIASGEARFLKVPAVCINGGLPVPGRDDRFRGVSRVSSHVERFLRETPHHPEMVVQAGVWALTDGYDRQQIKDRLVTRSSSGRVVTGISDSDIDGAKAVLGRLGLQTSLSRDDDV